MFRFLFRLVVVVLLAAAVWLLWFRSPSTPGVRSWSGEWRSDPPVVTTTPGGFLEAATLRMTENFYRADSRTWWGIYLGETVSQIQASSVYRYGVPLTDDAWEIVTRENIGVVIAPALRPSLPVAIDTATLRERTESGWLRFDKELNLAELRRSMSAELETRAGEPERIALAKDAARRTIGEFIEEWLLARGEWQAGMFSSVKVYFADEVGDDVRRQLR